MCRSPVIKKVILWAVVMSLIIMAVPTPVRAEESTKPATANKTTTGENVSYVKKLANALATNETNSNFGRTTGKFSWDTESKGRSWTYYNGIMMDAFLMLDNDVYKSKVESFYNKNIGTSKVTVSIKNITTKEYEDRDCGYVDNSSTSDNYYRPDELDSIPPTRAMFDLIRGGSANSAKYLKMIEWVYTLMQDPTWIIDNKSGTFIHKRNNSSWSTYQLGLDGLFMSQPFFMELANDLDGTSGSSYIKTNSSTLKKITPSTLYDAVCARLKFVDDKMFNNTYQLYNHGWGPNGTGGNGVFWLRAIGWYAAALADTICMLPASGYESQKEELVNIVKKMFSGENGATIKGLLDPSYRDADTGMWYNVVNMGTSQNGDTAKNDKGSDIIVLNDLETSGSALLAYTLLRLYAGGYLDDEYGKAGLETFNGIVTKYVTNKNTNTPHLTNVYRSAGVYTEDAMYCDQSLYKTDEAKGVGPLMMAASYANAAAEQFEKATTLTVTPPTAESITYGDSLADSALTGGSVVNGNGKTIEGTFAWEEPETTPTAGEKSYNVIFTAKETVYGTATTTVSLTVDKAQPSYEAPSLTAVYGQSLEEISFPSASNGSWAWADAATSVGIVGEHTFPAVFTPSDEENYNASEVNVTVVVGKKPVTISGITAENKTYDGNTNASLVISGVTIAGIIDGDELTVTATGTFADANAGDEKTVSISDLALSGPSVGNYELAEEGQQASTNANITPRSVIISGITAKNKTYDKTAAATIVTTGVSFEGLVEGDNLNISATGTFDNANAGKNKTVTLFDLALVGDDVGNYELAATGQQETTTATIAKAALTITAQPQSKTYGDEDPAFTYTKEGLIEGDFLSGNLDREAGENVGAYAIEIGTLIAGDNYEISYTPANLTISQKAVNIKAKDQTVAVGQSIDSSPGQAELTGVLTGHLLDSIILSADTSAVTTEGVITPTEAVIKNGDIDVTDNYAITYEKGKLTVTQGTVTIIKNPTAAAITYGQKLSDSALSGGEASVPGTFAWSDASFAPSVADSGKAYDVIFTPTDTVNFSPVTIGIPVTVNKADPTYTEPEGLTATYGQKLSDIPFTQPDQGLWSWNDPDTSVGIVGNKSFLATFTPADTDNYKTVTKEISVTVEKVNPDYEVPYGLSATYGQKLSDITLPSGWAWQDKDASVGDAGEKSFLATYTPSDTDNYNVLSDISIPVYVNQATPAYDDSFILTATYGQKLSEIIFPEDSNGTWSWKEPDTSVGDVGTKSFKAIFTPTDNHNYRTIENLPISVAVEKKPLTITAAAKEKTYGDADPSFTYTADGILADDSITGTLSREEGEGVGRYAITIGSLSAGNNYEVSYVPADLTITAREVGISWSDTTFTYDGNPHVPVAVVTGLVNGDICTVIVEGAQTEAGTYEATVVKLSNANYALPEVGTTTSFVIQAVEGHSHDGVVFEKWEGTTSLPSVPGNYYLAVDVVLSETWAVPDGNTSLCLNEHRVRKSDASTPIIRVGSGAVLNLYDCKGSGVITTWDGTGAGFGFGPFGFRGYPALLATSITDPLLSDGTVNGGGIFIDGGTVNMYGGTITGNSVSGNGGGIWIGNGGTLTMKGGNVTGNNADGYGNDIYQDGTMNIGGSPTIGEVYLPTEKKLTVTAPLDDDASIGLAMETPGVFTEGLNGNGALSVFKIGGKSLTSSGEGQIAEEGSSAGDLSVDGSVSVSGLSTGDKVNFYRVLEFDPDATSTGGWVANTQFSSLTTKEIQQILSLGEYKEEGGGIDETLAAKIAGMVTSATTPTYPNVSENSGTARVDNPVAGLYLALVTPGEEKVVYNPIFVAADYDDKNGTNTWVVDLKESYSSLSMAKKSQITLDKSASTTDGDPDGVAVGDVITFTVETTIPEYSDDYSSVVFKLSDVLSEGLELQPASIKVYAIKKSNTTPPEITEKNELTKADTYAAGKAYKLITNTSGNEDTFTVDFWSKYILGLDKATDILVEYQAIVTTDAPKSVNLETNTVTLNYSTTPSDNTGNGTLKDQTKHYTFDIDANILGDDSWKTTEIVKVGVGADGKEITASTLHEGQSVGALEGATFKLYVATDHGSTTKLKDKDGHEFNAKPYTNRIISADSVIVSDASGRLTIQGEEKPGIRGLDLGTYYLVEETAPAGYIRSTSAVKIEINATEWEDKTYTENGLTWTVKELKSYEVEINGNKTASYSFKNVADSASNLALSSDKATKGDRITGSESEGMIGHDGAKPGAYYGKIVNTQGAELPSTGGEGTKIFYSIGALLMLFGGILIVSHRRAA